MPLRWKAFCKYTGGRAVTMRKRELQITLARTRSFARRTAQWRQTRCRGVKNRRGWNGQQDFIAQSYAVLMNTAPFRLDKSRKVLPSLRFAETPQDDDIVVDGLGIRSRSLRGNPRHTAALPRAARRTWVVLKRPQRHVQLQAGRPK